MIPEDELDSFTKTQVVLRLRLVESLLESVIAALTDPDDSDESDSRMHDAIQGVYKAGLVRDRRLLDRRSKERRSG